MIKYEGRTYFLGGARRAVIVYADDRPEEQLPRDTLPYREEQAALKALVAAETGRFYAWGRQDAIGTVETSASIAFGDAYGLHVFKFELEQSTYQQNVRAFYEEWLTRYENQPRNA